MAVCKVCKKATEGSYKLCTKCRYPKKGYKRCMKCDKVLPRTEFYNNGSKQFRYCKACHIIQNAYRSPERREACDRGLTYTEAIRLLALTILHDALMEGDEMEYRDIEFWCEKADRTPEAYMEANPQIYAKEGAA